MKAIETCYNGYRFRSRLEARWAVFFDMAGILYQYEPEGFELKDGTYYLPDFYLPWFNAYVEIKPKGIADETLKKAKRGLEMLFHESERQKKAMLFIGDPADDGMMIYSARRPYTLKYYENECFSGDLVDSLGENEFLWLPMRFLEGAWLGDDVNDLYPSTGHSMHWITVAIGHEKEENNYLYFYENEFEEPFLLFGYDFEQRARVTGYRWDFEHEKTAARQARFEHGEKPNTRRLKCQTN